LAKRSLTSTADELDPTVPEYFANRGLCFFNRRDFKNADADLTHALELGATATRLYFFRGQVRRALGNAAGADEDQAAGLKLVPNDELSWISRGFYFVESDPDQAISDFQSAIRLNPRSASAWENCAAVYADRLSQLPKAIACMDELVRIEPENPKHWASRGSLRARADQRDEALADAQAALKLSDSGETLYRVGSVFARLAEKHPEDGDQAMALIRAAASKDPLFVLRYLGKDPDLNPILERPDFVELSQRLLSLKSTPKPQ
jgi:tetratricopeptide (TPR) repeat protein